jgi:hypothetical protein
MWVELCCGIEFDANFGRCLKPNLTNCRQAGIWSALNRGLAQCHGQTSVQQLTNSWQRWLVHDGGFPFPSHHQE